MLSRMHSRQVHRRLRLQRQTDGGGQMSEIRDPAIKLFGKTIPLSESGERSDLTPVSEASEADEKNTRGNSKDQKVEDQVGGPRDEACKPNSPSSIDEENQQTPDRKTEVEAKPGEVIRDTDTVDQDKALKKPDKILPCPRCNSLDTKFCYYNNYNVNQPRHFCKNCQRYWTAGGTMRNVPVGAGRRKNKHASSHYRHVVVSPDGASHGRVDITDGNHQMLTCGVNAPSSVMKSNGTLLRFGTDAHLCESMEAVLNLGDQRDNVEMGVVPGGEESEEPSSSVNASTEMELPEHVCSVEPEVIPRLSSGTHPSPPLQSYAPHPWPYLWNSGWNNVSDVGGGQVSSKLAHGQESSNPSPVRWGPPPIMIPPTFRGPSLPFHFVPNAASYWSWIPGWVGGPWSFPWVMSNGTASPSSSSNSGCSGNGSPTLGKHSRDVTLPADENPEKCLWVPKTLRIDGPENAAKSSIWATLGIKPDKTESTNKEGIFKSFQSKMGNQDNASDASQVLLANPAALSRSQTFQENNT